MKVLLRVFALALCASAVSAVDDLFEIYGGVSAFWYETVDSVNGFVADPEWSYNTKYWSNNASAARITFFSNWGSGTNRHKLGSVHGAYGSDHAEYFGLLDADGTWAVRIENNSDIRFLINDVNKMTLNNEYLVLAGKLKLDGNDSFIATYSNYSFILQSDNASTVKLDFKDGTGTTTDGKVVASGNGVNFGLQDADEDWVFRSIKDQEIRIAIDNDNKIIIYPEYIDMKKNVKVPPGGDLSMGNFTQQP